MELAADNLGFLLAAAHSPTLANSKRSASEADLLPLSQPNVKWRRRGNRAPVTMCDWRDAGGKWHTCSAMPAKLHNHDAMQIAVRECELRCQQFYAQHHV